MFKLNLKRLKVTFHLRSGEKRIAHCSRISITKNADNSISGFELFDHIDIGDNCLYLRLDAIDMITFREVFRFF